MSQNAVVGLLLSQPIKAKGAKTNTRTPTPPEAKFAVAYLSEFGYFKDIIDAVSNITLDDILKAIKLFQNWFGLPKNGLLTSQTVKAMEAPRCGHPDIVREHHVEEVRLRDFAEVSLARWRKHDLKYFVEAYVAGISKSEQDGVFQAAFDAWCQYGQINAVSVSSAGEADIVITTGEGQRSNFDGPGGTLAWAYLPDGSDQQLTMKFDLGETWTTDPRGRGIVLLNVATHEFGHLFGLDHSKTQTALMAPYYNVNTATPQQDDDIPRFIARYGQRTSPGPAPGPAPVSGEIVLSYSGTLKGITVNGRKVV